MSIIGEAIIKLTYDGKSGNASLQATQKDAEKKLSKFQEAVVVKGAKIASSAVVAGATAITAVATGAVKQFAEFEQISGGIQKIFNEMDYSVIEKDANDAWKSMNISASEYMKQISGVGSIFAQTMGDKKGYETARTGMQAIADYASGTGASVDELMQKFQMISRSTTSYQSIADQFAGILPQTTTDFLKQAQAAGFLSDKYKKLNDVPVAEYQEAIAKMLENGVDKMGLLGNTAEETEGTISGSFNAMKANWQNLVVSFGNGGKDLDKIIENLGKNFMDIARQAIPRLIDAIVSIADVLVEYMPRIVSFIVQMLIKIVTAVIPQLPKILTALILGIVQFFVELSKPENLNMVMNAMVELLRGLLLALPVILDALAEAIPEIITNIIAWLLDPEALAMLIDASVQLFMALVLAVPKILQSLFTAFVNLFSKLWGKLQNVFQNFAGKFGEAIGRVFKNAINGVFDFIEGFINTPINAINGLIDVINKIPNVNMGKLATFKFQRLASGGVTQGSTIANIGEAGREAVIPLERNVENWAQPMAKAIAQQFNGETGMGREINVYMTNNINNNLDADEIGRRLMTSIRRAA